jgi:Na+/H+-dicarboxylate symporter
MASQRGESAAPVKAARKGLDKSHYLYIAVIVAVVLGAVIGLLFPEVGKSLKPLGDGFIKLIKMMIAPIIFCSAKPTRIAARRVGSTGMSPGMMPSRKSTVLSVAAFLLGS